MTSSKYDYFYENEEEDVVLFDFDDDEDKNKSKSTLIVDTNGCTQTCSSNTFCFDDD